MGYEKKNYGDYTGTWIPAIIMLNEKLKPMEKMLYAELASFTQCYASNKWLAERLGISERTVQTGIAKLKKLRLITVFETDKHQRICTAATQNLHPPTQKLRTPHAEIAIKNNNIKNNKKETHTSASADATVSDSSTGREAQETSPSSAAPLRSEGMVKIFNVVSGILHQRKPILMTDTRLRHLRARLKHFKPSELQVAAGNLMQDPWNTGQNPNNKVYASYDFLMRSDEQVEKWLNATPAKIKKSIF